MSATSKVVDEEDGKPTGVVEEESAATITKRLPNRPRRVKPTAWIRPVKAGAATAAAAIAEAVTAVGMAVEAMAVAEAISSVSPEPS